MPASDDESRRTHVTQLIEGAFGLDLERAAEARGPVDSMKDALDRDALAAKIGLAEKLSGVGVVALGAATGATWAASAGAGRLAKTWPAVTALAEGAERLHEAMLPAWEQMQPLIETLNRLGRIAVEAQKGWRTALPPNLREIESVRVGEMADFLSQEGIPLYLVPRASTALALLGAESRAERRAVLGNRARSIIADCRAVLAEHRMATTDQWATLLDAGLRAYAEGHTEAAQALAMVVLDSITFALPSSSRRRYTKHPNGIQDFGDLVDDDSLSTALAILPLWAVHEANCRDAGHPVPQALNRHASLHRASARQYSKRNAIQAIMLATSLLGWFAELGEPGSRSTRPGRAVHE